MPTASIQKQPVNGRCNVTTSAELLTQIVESGTNTTFTNRQVKNGDGWVLTDVAPGYVLKVVDGDEEYRGQVDSVDDANNIIVVHAWLKGGVSGVKLATMKPSDGSVVYVLKTDRCKRLIVDALDANTASVYIGFESSLSVSYGHPIALGASHANHGLTLEVGLQ